MPSERARLPWEIVETLPGTSAGLRQRWSEQVRLAADRTERARALVGWALTSYWAVQAGVEQDDWVTVAARRGDAVDEAEALAREVGEPDLLAEVLLGQLHARWGPDHVAARPSIVAELEGIHDDILDEELRYQVRSWSVLRALDGGDVRRATSEVDRVARECEGTRLVLFPRRVRLWRANLAMLRGDIDEAVVTNQEVVADTAPTTGAPFSFQNAMVTFGIERFFRRGLGDVVDPVRSVRASSPRVSANWDAALAFSLAEAGRLDEAADVFEPIASDLDAIPRDLNWLVVFVLLALTAVDLGDGRRVAVLRERLEPFARYDATHGSGYASYGPVGRVVAKLAACSGDLPDATVHLAGVLVDRDPGPWTSLARLDLARLDLARVSWGRISSEPASSVVEGSPAELAEQAATELAGFGLAERAADARTLARSLRETDDSGPVARRDGTTWSLRHATGEAVVRHSRGVELLVQLLARPGATVYAADIDGVDPDLPRRAVVETVIDAEARRRFRTRLDELERRPRRRPADDEEIAALRGALAGAGQVPAGSVELERTRVRVTKAIRRAVDGVAASSPGLGAHLAASISTGRTCVYAPGDGIAWRVVEGGPFEPSDGPGSPCARTRSPIAGAR